MAAPRLTFLYPNLLRSIRSCEPATRQSLANPVHRTAARCRTGFHTTHQSQQETFAQQRYGTANEPKLPPPPKPKKDFEPTQNITQELQSTETKRDPRPAEQEPKKDADTSPERVAPPDPPVEETSTPPVSQDAQTPPEQSAEASTQQNPLDAVLSIPPPSETTEHKPPHLATPPYVHHFDTYTLVRNLEGGGFTQDQAVTVMKAIRSLLAINLDIAKEGLVSKSDVENETYLFRAACSEMSSALQASRTAENQGQRAHRAHLFHESDIITQRITQELMGLKEDLKGMMSDRKMAVQTEQRLMASRIQELNYKITVLLNSDSRSEVEGLRWVLTRRAAMAIVLAAAMMLGALKYSSWKLREEEEREKKLAKSMPLAISSTVASREIGTQT